MNRVARWSSSSGCDGTSPVDAEVVDGRDQPLAEQVVPDAVDHHPRRERVLRAGEPFGQLEPAALLGVDRRAVRDVEHAEEPAGHDRARASPPRRGCGSRCRRPSCASRTPRATVAVGRRVGQGEQLALQPVHLLPGDRLLRAGRRGRACRPPACRGSPRTRPWPRPAAFLAFAIFSAVAASGGRPVRACSSIVGVVVVQPAAAHLVPQAGAEVGAAEDAGQGVIVGGRDRVELVVVAAGAARRQRQHRPADRVDLLVDVVHDEADLEPLVDVLDAQRQEPVAISCSVALCRRRRRAAGRRRSARG